MKTKKNYLYITITLIIGVFLGSFFSFSEDAFSEKRNQKNEHKVDAIAYWTCSMHHQIHREKSGTCPVCGMDLVPVKTENSGVKTSLDHSEITLSPIAAKLAMIKTTPVKRGNPGGTLHLIGEIKANQKTLALITARFQGRIEELNVNFEGQKIYKGEPLATLYSPDLMIAQKELIAAKKLQKSQPDYFKAAKEKLLLWGITDRQIEHILDKGAPQRNIAILSPTSGTVLTKNVAIGEYVKSGQMMFEIADLNRLWAVFDAYETDLSLLEEGYLIHFTTSASSRTFIGRIDFIGSIVNTQKRTTKIRVVVENKAHLLKPGMFVEGVVNITTNKGSKKLYIPESAVLWTGKRAVVYVKEHEKGRGITFSYREVVLGPKTGDYYIIKSGLKAGEIVASHGAFQIDATAQLNGKKSMMNP